MKRMFMLTRLVLLFLIALGALLTGCAIDMGQNARYGNYGGPPRQQEPKRLFSLQETDRGASWFPNHVRFSPDDKQLLVSLCYVYRVEFCRVGKYFIDEKRWEILPHEPDRTYRWPTYSPDGQWIVVSTAKCNEHYTCPMLDYKLAKMPPDGTQLIRIADSSVEHATFSANGKKLIYWKLVGLGLPTYDVFELDWASGKERALTDFHFNGLKMGWPYFLPDGERFVFSAQVKDALRWIYLPNKLLPERHASEGTPLDRTGPNKDVIIYAADVRDAPIGHDNFLKLILLWPGEERYALHDISSDGRVLYQSSLFGNKTHPAAESLGERRRSEYLKGIGANRKTPSNKALFMRRPDADASVDLLLDVGYATEPSLSWNGRRLAYIQGAAIGISPDHRLAIYGIADQSLEFIDWPRLELK